MTEIDWHKYFKQGGELPFILPVSDTYFEDGGDTITIRSRAEYSEMDIVDEAERKTGTREWLVVLGYPVKKDGVTEWQLRYFGRYPRKEKA
jgi:hypothetical protein